MSRMVKLANAFSDELDVRRFFEDIINDPVYLIFNNDENFTEDNKSKPKPFEDDPAFKINHSLERAIERSPNMHAAVNVEEYGIIKAAEITGKYTSFFYEAEDQAPYWCWGPGKGSKLVFRVHDKRLVFKTAFKPDYDTGAAEFLPDVIQRINLRKQRNKK